MSQAKFVRPRIRRGALVMAVFSGVSFAFIALVDAAPVAPDGIWFTKGQESIIKVHPCTEGGEDFCGTLVWLKEPKEADGSPKVDKLNKDPEKKGKPMVGLDILLGMKADDDHWTGKAYNPDDGKLYDITFHVKTEKEDNDTADLRGCILGFLCQTETFARAKSIPGGNKSSEGAGKKKTKKDAAQR